ncbi:hypothetical protein P4H71_09385 [Paenibacillus kribbensis]|uniref:hypothetical protein n=1 Tax=Paenibacillus kribbensis TaxID=172713 RepID=UPI002DB88F6B|nr:hypothetical protein [Paenibacillus kribbensis]MEC0234537.1 hypothetical protein [Paenibacillus kribbensis]
MTYNRTTEMDGLSIFYREAGDRNRAALRSSSHFLTGISRIRVQRCAIDRDVCVYV